MKNKGYTVIELIVVIVVLGLFTLLTITSVSYAFTDKKSEAYESEINYILAVAKVYGDQVKEEIQDSKHGITISVEKLIEKGLIVPNKDGKIVDPRKEDADLNDLRIRIILNNNKIETEVVE